MLTTAPCRSGTSWSSWSLLPCLHLRLSSAPGELTRFSFRLVGARGTFLCLICILALWALLHPDCGKSGSGSHLDSSMIHPPPAWSLGGSPANTILECPYPCPEHTGPSASFCTTLKTGEPLGSWTQAVSPPGPCPSSAFILLSCSRLEVGEQLLRCFQAGSGEKLFTCRPAPALPPSEAVKTHFRVCSCYLCPSSSSSAPWAGKVASLISLAPFCILSLSACRQTLKPRVKAEDLTMELRIPFLVLCKIPFRGFCLATAVRHMSLETQTVCFLVVVISFPPPQLEK